MTSAASPDIRPEDDKSHRLNTKSALLCDWWQRLRLNSQLNQSYLPSNPNEQSGSGLKKKFCLKRCPRRVMAKIEAQGQRGKSEELKRAKYPPLAPNDYLLNALRNIGHNLDNVEPQDSVVDRSKSRQKPIPPFVARGRRPTRLCLQMILAEYMQFVEPLMARVSELGAGQSAPTEWRLDNELAEVFCSEHLEYLEARGYSAADVATWAWILRSNTTYEAMLRVFALEELGKRHGPDAPGIPHFIPLFFLRTKDTIEAKAFRLILTYSLHLIRGRPLPTLYHFASGGLDTELDQEALFKHTKTSIDPNMCVALVDSLLHHGRQVWPQSQLEVARAFAFYLTRPPDEVADAQKDQFKAEKANKFLKTLSLPSNESPFASASIQQQAQFEILKAMAGQRPVLPITREGYRGIITVQLAHKKTALERQSTELKAPSWPPWKEDKLGIDSQRDGEELKSRAMQVVNQMKHAGYLHSSWEEVASILAGWDTDKSPTIQTRGRIHRASPDPFGKPDYVAIWIARVRATRTVREAWACFLSYQDLGHPPHRAIYKAMAEKLIFREKAVKEDFDQISSALPGDGLEVFPEPSSARDVIYVNTNPPTLDEFLKQMLSQGIRPGERFLALLLRSARTFNEGLDYISCSDLTNCQIKALCAVQGGQPANDIPDRKILDEVPDPIFSAFIKFLCKFSGLDTYLDRSDIHMADTFPIIMSGREAAKSTTLFAYAQKWEPGSVIDCPKILSHAIRLVKSRNSQSPQPWMHLLFCLNTSRISERPLMDSTMQLVLAWFEIVEVVGWMNERGIEPGLYGFQTMCRSFIKAVTAAVKHPDAAERALELVERAMIRKNLVHCGHVNRTPEDLVQNGLRVLKKHFDQLVLLDPKILQSTEIASNAKGPPNSRVTVPSMPHVPTPVVLHAFVRALGTAEDSDGLLSLLRWMKQTAPILQESADEFLTGRRMMRRTVVAMRVYLEQPRGKPLYGPSSAQYSYNESGEPVFPDPNLQEAYEIIEGTELLGPWPDAQEVSEYMNWER